jgi:hypothetical protein
VPARPSFTPEKGGTCEVTGSGLLIIGSRDKEMSIWAELCFRKQFYDARDACNEE